ncbi:MAG: Gfo/Idh/MocA family oxidoreductase [Phycisphaerae bacterium]|nr:Gfo/Idh/MocA family oxidoreductase [Phycisphaerae bacterium]
MGKKNGTINVALFGAGFMGKAHSNACLKVNKFFDLPARVVMHTLVTRNAKRGQSMADRWGWKRSVADLDAVVNDPEIDLVDICVPNNEHAGIAIAAARAGKPVACEKPLAHNLADAKKMVAAVKSAGVQNFVWFNYRRVPALALARRLIDEGRIGRVYHFRATYLQDWIMDPNFPLVWRLRGDVAGSGSHGDLGAHLIDMARYLVGEFAEVVGHQETFVKQRPVETGLSERGLSGVGSARGRKKPVTVDDATMFLARFANGALGTFEATRFARGRKNDHGFELNGDKGSLVFRFDRMNELEFFDATAPHHVQGFTTIQVSESEHPYAGAYWPPAHWTGYEHAFINQLADAVTCLAGGRGRMKFHPNFQDGLASQQVLDAVERSAKSRRWVKVAR